MTELIAARFEIIELAGKGGMGAVYRARDRQTGALVALKLQLAERAGDGERFAREARILAELEHTAIVRHVAHGDCADGRLFIAMEWLEGEDLAVRLRRGPLDIEAGVELCVRVAEALRLAHAAGVVHRDLKPSNVFLPGGEVAQAKLIDFGVARVGAGSHGLTATGMAVGTPGYMAPEQARGEAKIDSRADVFALGCVIFECLTGRPAFQADHPLALLAKILLDEVPRVAELRADCPGWLDALVAAMLAKDRSRRPGAAADVLEALRLREELAPASAGGGLGRGEQRVLSVIAARRRVSQTDPEGDTESWPLGPDLNAALAPFELRLEVVAGDGVVATLRARGVATDHAARAARAALVIAAQFQHHVVALATGRAELDGERPLGDVIERTAALLAEPETMAMARGLVRIDESTAGLLDARFEVGGRVLLRELDVSEEVRAVLGRRTPCVGRDAELALLRAAFAQCVSDCAARALVIIAAAGLGKSRLRAELCRAVRKSHPEVEIFLARGDSMSAGSMYSLAAPLLRRACGVVDSAPAPERQRALRERLARAPDGDEHTFEFLAEMLGAAPPPSALLAAARRDPPLMSEQLEQAFGRWLSAEAAARPLCVVLEDLHWGDAPSLRLFGAALRAAEDKPLFVIAFARPELPAGFTELLSSVATQRVELPPLTRRASERLVAEIAGSTLSPEVIARIVERAAGHPFLIEELVRASSTGATELPESALSMVQSRLEVLSDTERRALRAASVFGERFWDAGVLHLLAGQAAPAARESGELPGCLEALERAETIHAAREPRFAGCREYRFRHALVREAVYASLTPEDKQKGHRLAAEWLERAGERDARVLATHHERAGDLEAAVRWNNRAARAAFGASDFVVALELAERSGRAGVATPLLGEARAIAAAVHSGRGDIRSGYGAALAALDAVAVGSEPWTMAAGLCVFFGGVLGVEPPFERLRPGLLTHDWTAVTPAQAYAAFCYIWINFYLGRRDAAVELLDVLDFVAESANADPSVVGWVELGRAHAAAFCDGDPWRAQLLAGRAVSAFERAADITGSTAAGQVHGSLLLGVGSFDEAEEALARAQALCLRYDMRWLRSWVEFNLSTVPSRKRTVEQTTALQRLCVERSMGDGTIMNEGFSRGGLAGTLAFAGDAAGARGECDRALELLARFPGLQSFVLSIRAELMRGAGAHEAALADARCGLALVERHGGWVAPELALRVAEIECLLSLGQREDASARAVSAAARLEACCASMPTSADRERFLTRLRAARRLVSLAADLAPP
jgi:predicted Ser/Thr protein kinase